MHPHSVRITRRSFLYGSALTSIAALSACSGVGPTGDGNPTTPPTSGGGAPGGSGGSASGSGAATAVKVTVAQGVDPTTLDPMQQRETTTENVLIQLYDTLLTRSTEDGTKFDGVLVENYKMVDDITMSLTLKKDVTFSDGSAFTSADVVYSFDYLLGRGEFSDPSIAAYQFGTIDKVVADGDGEVTITTKEPDPLLAGRLTQLFVIKDKSLAKDPKKLASTAIGTGPYTLDRWDRNSQVVLTARKDYHGGTPKVQNVVFRTIPDDASRLAALKTGDVDLITNVPADNIAELKSNDKVRVVDVPSARIASVWLNTLDGGPLAKRDVRVALNHAIDVDSIIKYVMSGYGKRVATFVPEYFEGYDASIKPITFDPTAARKLLADAGYADGFEMTLMVPQGRYPFATEVVQAMIPYLKDVGVTLKMNVVEFGVFASATQARKIGDGFYGAWGNSFFNPLDELTVAVVSGDRGFSWYSNKEVDKLTAKAGETIDADQRVAILQAIERDLLDDPPFIFLFAYIDLYGLSSRLDFKPRSDELLPMRDATVTG